AGRDVVPAREPREDRQAGRVGRRPRLRPEPVRAQVPDRAGPRGPAAAGARHPAELVQRAAVLVDDQHVVIGAALELRPRRDRIRRRGEEVRGRDGERGGGDDGGKRAHTSTAGYRDRISSMNAANRAAIPASSISSTFSAFSSPECERLKLPTNVVSSHTVTFACM